MKLLRVLTLILFSVIVLFFIVGELPFVKKYAIKTLKSAVKENTGWDLEVGHVSLQLPFTGDVYDVHLSHEEGKSLFIEKVSFRISAFTLLRLGTGINLPELSLTGIQFSPEGPKFGMEGSFLANENFENYEVASTLHTDLFDIEMHGELSLTEGDFSLGYQLHGDLPPRLKFLLDKGEWRGKFSSRTGYLLAIDQIEGKSGILEAEGHCLITQTMKLEKTWLHLKCDSLSSISKDFEGAAHATVVAIGSYNNPYISLKGNATPFSFRGAAVNDAQFSLNILINSDQIEGDTTLIADDLEIFSHFTLDTQVHIDEIHLAAPNSRLDGQLTFDYEKLKLEGALKGYTTELERWSRATGEAALKCAFDYDDDLGQSVIYNLEILHGAVRNIQFTGTRFQGALTHFWDQPNGEILVRGDKIRYGEHEIENLLFQTNLSEETFWPFLIETRGEQEGAAHLNAKGKWNRNGLRLESCSGSIFGYPFSLADRVQATLKENSLAFTPLFFHLASGSVYLAMDNTAETIHSTFRLHDTPIELLTMVMPNFTAKGLLSADIFLFGQRDNLQGQFKAHFRGVKIEEKAFEKLPPFQGNLQASLLENTLECRGTITDIGEQPITVDAKLPMKGTLSPPSITFDSERPLFADIKAAGPIAPILQLLAIDAPNFGGEAVIDLKVDGNMNTPLVYGSLVLKDGYFESLESGALFQNLTAKIHGDGDKLILKEFRGSCGEGGTLKGHGAIHLDQSNHFPFAVDLELDHANLVNLSEASATMSGDLHFRGNFHQAKIQGDLIADKVQLVLSEEPTSLTHHVNVEYFNQPEKAKSPTPYQDLRVSWPIELELSLESSSRISISDRSLNSEWSGKAKLGGTVVDPLIDGELKLRKGTYRFRGRDLKLEEGNISFANVPFEKGKLYVVASMDMKDIVVEIISKGELMDPALSLRSKPPLSQREILSRMIFNKSLADITPFQSKEITKSIKNLNKSGQDDPLQTLQQSVGIDRIDIAETEYRGNKDVSVEVGKYITDKIVLIVRKNVNTEGNQVGIETTLSDHIKLQAEYSNDKTGQINLIWKNDY